MLPCLHLARLIFLYGRLEFLLLAVVIRALQALYLFIHTRDKRVYVVSLVEYPV